MIPHPEAPRPGADAVREVLAVAKPPSPDWLREGLRPALAPAVRAAAGHPPESGSGKGAAA